VTFRLRENTASVRETAAHVTDHPANRNPASGRLARLWRSVARVRARQSACRSSSISSGRGEFPKILLLLGDRTQLLAEDGCQLPLFTYKAVAHLLKVAQELVSLPLSQ
jgi:hypothetical protein